jgi:hypothetical protein
MRRWRRSGGDDVNSGKRHAGVLGLIGGGAGPAYGRRWSETASLLDGNIIIRPARPAGISYRPRIRRSTAVTGLVTHTIEFLKRF